MRALSFFSMMAVLLLGNAQAGNVLASPAEPANAAPLTNDTMTAIKGSLDSLAVLPSAFTDGKILKIIIAPVQIEYPRKRRDPQPYYRDSDFQLTPRDVGLLQKTIAETFTASWFEKRHWQLVTDPASADVRLVVDLKDFWLAAPLNESIQVYRTYTEESVRFTLTGRIERISDGKHLVEFSDKRKVRQMGAPTGRFERFSVLTFWRDMRIELGIFAGQINRLTPSGTLQASADNVSDNDKAATN